MTPRAAILLLALAMAAAGAELKAFWTSPTNLAGISGYQVALGTNAGSYQTTNPVAGSASVSAIFTNLASGRVYYLRARSMGTNGVGSDWTPEVQQHIPPALSGLGVTNAGLLIIPGGAFYPEGPFIELTNRFLVPLAFGGVQQFYRTRMELSK